jgi:hypothetical protein
VAVRLALLGYAFSKPYVAEDIATSCSESSFRGINVSDFFQTLLANLSDCVASQHKIQNQFLHCNHVTISDVENQRLKFRQRWNIIIGRLMSH